MFFGGKCWRASGEVERRGHVLVVVGVLKLRVLSFSFCFTSG